MEENVLAESMQAIGYSLNQMTNRELPNGKRFVRIDFARKSSGC